MFYLATAKLGLSCLEAGIRIRGRLAMPRGGRLANIVDRAVPAGPRRLHLLEYCSISRAVPVLLQSVPAYRNPVLSPDLRQTHNPVAGVAFLASQPRNFYQRP